MYCRIFTKHYHLNQLLTCANKTFVVSLRYICKHTTQHDSKSDF